MLKRALLVTLLGITALLGACGGGGGGGDDGPPTAVATTAAGNLIVFNVASPNNVTGTVPLTLGGLPIAEAVAGIDRRPANDVVYLLGTAGNLYTVNTSTGALTFIAALTADPADLTAPYAGLMGTQFGVDFNPVPDRLRVVSDTGQNLRINVANGLVTTDTDINPAGPVISAVAYTNSFAGAVATTLYDIDATAGFLYIQNPPNDGTLTSPVTLGVSAATVNGFDIEPVGTRGYAALTVGGVTSLYVVNVAAVANAATLVGTIGTGVTAITGFTLLNN